MAMVVVVCVRERVGSKVKDTSWADWKDSAFASPPKKAAVPKTAAPTLNIDVKNNAKYVRLFITIIIHEHYIFRKPIFGHFLYFCGLFHGAFENFLVFDGVWEVVFV